MDITSYKGDKSEIVGVGKIDGDKYKTTRKPSHFFVKYNGFAITKRILANCIQKGVKEIIITYIGKRGVVVFKSKIEDWEKGEEYLNKIKGNDDIDVQIVLNKNKMEEVANK